MLQKQKFERQPSCDLNHVMLPGCARRRQDHVVQEDRDRSDVFATDESFSNSTQPRALLEPNIHHLSVQIVKVRPAEVLSLLQLASYYAEEPVPPSYLHMCN